MCIEFVDNEAGYDEAIRVCADMFVVLWMYYDATAAKNILFIVPISGSTINNLIDPESHVIDGGVIRQGKTATSVGRITDEVEDEGSDTNGSEDEDEE